MCRAAPLTIVSPSSGRSDFLFARVLIGMDELKSLLVRTNDFFHMAVVDWGLIMAAGVMVPTPAGAFVIAVAAVPARQRGGRRPKGVGEGRP